MLQTATMLAGLWAVWLLVTQAPLTPEQLGIGAGVAFMCALIAARFCGMRDLGAPVGVGMRRLRHAPEDFRAALSTARAAIAADVSLRPGLVRIKPRVATDTVKAAFAAAVSARPGWVAVESDADGMLAHVLDEEAVQPHDISAIEDGVRAAYGLRDPS